jgi:hypothetical protein
MDFVHTRLFGKVDLPPSLFFSQFSDPLPEPNGCIGHHASRIGFVLALNLVYTLSIVAYTLLQRPDADSQKNQKGGRNEAPEIAQGRRRHNAPSPYQVEVQP